MAVKFTVIPKRDISKGAAEGAVKYHGRVRRNGVITFEQICRQASLVSTVSTGDVEAVVSSIIDVSKDHLLNGSSVKLGKFGTLRVNAGSRGVNKPEDFHTSMFRRGKIIYTPGKELREVKNNLRFERIGDVAKGKSADTLPDSPDAQGELN